MLTMRAACKVLDRFGVMTAIAALILGLAALTAGQGVSAAEFEEVIPDTDDRLTKPELQWCLFESVRLGGQRDASNFRMSWEVDDYNSRSNAYSEHCSNKEYYEHDKVAVEREMTFEKNQALRELGASRVARTRAEREARRVHVKDDLARVLAAPEETAAELGRVAQWGDLVRTGRVEGPWHEVEWHSPSPEQTLAFGWVLGGLLGGGPGTEARVRYCEAVADGGAQHNDVVRKNVDLDGTGWVKVDNGATQDAYMKLIGESDKVALSFYVAAGQTASVENIRTGSYEIAFATGSRFSRGCDSFSQRGYAEKFTRRIDYDKTTAGWTIELRSASDGNAHANSMSYDDFDKL